MWLKGLKFTLYYNLKENSYKIIYHLYMISEKLSSIYKAISNLCWKSGQYNGSFCHAWWTCKKARILLVQIHTMLQRILNFDNQFKPELFLLGLIYSQLEKSQRRLCLYMIIATKLPHAQKWEDSKIPIL